MFEDALLESAHRIQTRSRYWSILAMLINSGVLIAFAVWPLLHPQALPTQVMTSLFVAPPPPPPSPPQPPVKMQAQPQSLVSEIQTPSRISHATTIITNSAELQPAIDSMALTQANSDGGNSLSSLIGQTQPGRDIVRPAATGQKPLVSSGVMAGNLIAKTAPQYPVIAREARIQGTVVLQATIGKTGEIENLRVLSGPPMLRQAADAVRTWQYRPFYLNGEPVAVETTVNVVFNLGN